MCVHVEVCISVHLSLGDLNISSGVRRDMSCGDSNHK